MEISRGCVDFEDICLALQENSLTILSFEPSLFWLRLFFSEYVLTDVGCRPRVFVHSCGTPVLQDICVDFDGNYPLRDIGTHIEHIYHGIDKAFHVEKL